MSTSKDPAGKPALPTGQGAGFDDEDEWRHAPIAPKDQGPLESLGESISDAVTGPHEDAPAKHVPPGKPKA